MMRAAVAIAGRPVLARAGATFAVVTLPSLVLFGPQGLTARDLVRAMRGSLAAAVVVWTAWVALSAVATTAVFTAPGMSAVRGRHPGRWQRVAISLPLAALVHLPWTWLWLRGAGALAAPFAGETTAIVATHDRELAERVATRIVEVVGQ